MKNKVPHFVAEIAHKAARIPFVKPLFRPLYYAYKNHLKVKRNKCFRQNALDALKRFDACLSDNGFEYVLAFGTLLGAVREKGFIRHDLDIDVSMWAEDYTPILRECLENAGFKLDHSFEVEEGKLAREETYVYNDVSIDIFYFYPAIDDYTYCCIFLLREDCATYRTCMEKYGGAVPQRIQLPISRERIKTTFEDIELFIPSNYDEILKLRYGEDYMIPNPQWTISSYNLCIKEWPEMLGVYKEY